MACVMDRSPLDMRPQTMSVSDRGDEALLFDYTRLGGVMTGDELVVIARPFHDQAVSYVARAIVERRILTFTFRSAIFAPRFQFGAGHLNVVPSVRDAMAELAEVFEDNEMAAWFATPNCWLEQGRPCAWVALNPDAVVDAARADRHIAIGW